MENLGNVGGSQQRLDAVEACLWRGDIDGAVRLFDDWPHERVDQFIGYLTKHRHRIVNYQYYQAEGISIGSGAVYLPYALERKYPKANRQWGGSMCFRQSGDRGSRYSVPAVYQSLIWML
jgi:hypothetical protein